MRSIILTFWIASFASWAAGAALVAPPDVGAPIRGAKVLVGDFRDIATPPLPQLVSPVDFFRELLAMTPEQCERAIAEKPEARRSSIRAKLAEYAALAPEEREVRLRMTEIRWRLVPLMQMSPTNRGTILRGLPFKDRKLIQERLQQWDQLQPQAQKELLENQVTVDYFARLETSTPAQREAILQGLPADRRARIEADFNRWQAQSPGDRERLARGLAQFFELTDRERERILTTLPTSQRTQAQQTLDAIAKLPEDQRNHCLESYRKFTSLSPADREQFATNAARWQAMSETSRENWRKLARTLPPLPPLPPGLGVPPLSAVNSAR